MGEFYEFLLSKRPKGEGGSNLLEVRRVRDVNFSVAAGGGRAVRFISQVCIPCT